jgi:hypothetical protein
LLQREGGFTREKRRVLLHFWGFFVCFFWGGRVASKGG